MYIDGVPSEISRNFKSKNCQENSSKSKKLQNYMARRRIIESIRSFCFEQRVESESENKI